ncbi:MAG TPA: hypothetical protein PLN13_11820 [Bacteroidia bacterium]|nr:hypothetical protein [Bacteroidia bacterium]
MDLYSTFTDYNYYQKEISHKRKISLLYAIYDAFTTEKIKSDLIKNSHTASIDFLIRDSLEQVLPVIDNIELHKLGDLEKELMFLAKAIKTIPHSRFSEVNIAFIFDNLNPVVESNQMQDV